MDMYYDGPDGRNDLMFMNEEIGNSVSCRIIVRPSCDNGICHH